MELMYLVSVKTHEYDVLHEGYIVSAYTYAYTGKLFRKFEYWTLQRVSYKKLV